MVQDSGREELRPYLRVEPSLPLSTILVRGGPDNAALIRSHARRTHRLYCLDGVALFGISAFGAIDQTGPASRDGLLLGRLSSYEWVHLPTMEALQSAGFAVLATFGRPHFTLRLGDDSSAEVARLLAVLGPAEENPYNREVRLRQTERPQ